MGPVCVLNDLVRALADHRRGPRYGQAAWRYIGHARCTAVRRCLAKSRFAISLQSACATLPREEPVGGMLLRLTRSMRIRVGRVIALAYLFCVLAPAASLAWGSAPAPCRDDALVADRVPVHHQMQAGHTHDGASHDHAGPHAHHQAAAQDVPPAPHHHGGKATAGPGLALMGMVVRAG